VEPPCGKPAGSALLAFVKGTLTVALALAVAAGASTVVVPPFEPTRVGFGDDDVAAAVVAVAPFEGTKPLGTPNALGNKVTAGNGRSVGTPWDSTLTVACGSAGNELGSRLVGRRGGKLGNKPPPVGKERGGSCCGRSEGSKEGTSGRAGRVVVNGGRRGGTMEDKGATTVSSKGGSTGGRRVGSWAEADGGSSTRRTIIAVLKRQTLVEVICVVRL
jgi:hypothetical protein